IRFIERIDSAPAVFLLNDSIICVQHDCCCLMGSMPTPARNTSRTPLPQKQSLFSGMVQGDRVICLITPFDPRRVATVQQLMSLFGLTPAEARLAKAIGIGETLEVYAENSGLKVSTVRSQLKSIFAKTGTGRQTDLVRLISGIPVMR
ncbi:helix-turn-helix transcriptional regulator, partial [Accumulibacter sp.]|uniref:helix-turn-helix transcriptional regulator n=1 Tax=Accumulibacter sp. TaxID=2053492 RepID=UPI0035B02811